MVEEAAPAQALDYEALLAAPVRPLTTTRERIIRTATSFLGAPSKKIGGSTPQGFDCTGYVFHVYKQAAGITLPRHSHGQVQIGLHISPETLQPADLVYFKVRRSTSLHVGIYVGEGRFIHAPSTDGRITTASLGDAEWRARFLGARQIVPN